MLVALAHQLHHLGFHHRATDDSDRSDDVDQRRHAQFFIDIARRSQAALDGNNGVAVDAMLLVPFVLLGDSRAPRKQAAGCNTK